MGEIISALNRRFDRLVKDLKSATREDERVAATSLDHFAANIIMEYPGRFGLRVRGVVEPNNTDHYPKFPTGNFARYYSDELARVFRWDTSEGQVAFDMTVHLPVVPHHYTHNVGEDFVGHVSHETFRVSYFPAHSLLHHVTLCANPDPEQILTRGEMAMSFYPEELSSIEVVPATKDSMTPTYTFVNLDRTNTLVRLTNEQIDPIVHYAYAFDFIPAKGHCGPDYEPFPADYVGRLMLTRNPFCCDHEESSEESMSGQIILGPDSSDSSRPFTMYDFVDVVVPHAFFSGDVLYRDSRFEKMLSVLETGALRSGEIRTYENEDIIYHLHEARTSRDAQSTLFLDL